MLDEILEGDNVNLSHKQSLANLHFWAFSLHHLNIWIQPVQTLEILVYTTYLDNCIVTACFSALVLTLTLACCTVFIAFQSFSSVWYGMVYSLWYNLCAIYANLWISNVLLHYISSSICQQVCLVKNILFYLISVFYNLALNTINFSHFYLY